MHDNIDDLPTDTSIPNRTEIRLLNTFFKEKTRTVGRVFNELKTSILIGLLFAVLSLPPIDRLVKSVVKSAENPIILILCKTAVFIVLYYVLNNIWIIRK